MSEDKDYGVEDLCTSLDGIEEQLKRLVRLKKKELLLQMKASIEPEVVENI